MVLGSDGPAGLWAYRGAALLLILLAWFVYYPTLSYGFVYEDLNDPTRFFGGWQGWSLTLHEMRASPSRSLTGLSYALNQWGYGVMEPRGYHALNVALHLLNGALVWSLVGTSAAGLFALGLYLLHPLQVETVAYVSSRSDLLLATVCLLALVAANRRWWAGMLLASLGVFVKEAGICLIPITALWMAYRQGLTRAQLAWMACLGLLGVVMLASFLPDRLDPTYTASELVKLYAMAAQVLVPIGVTIDPDWSWISPLLAWQALLVTCLLVAAAVGLWRSRFSWLVLVVLVSVAPRLIVPLLEGLHTHHLAVAFVGVALCMGAQE